MVAQECGSRGPRIGSEVPICVLSKYHTSQHCADPSWGDVHWSDISFAGRHNVEAKEIVLMTSEFDPREPTELPAIPDRWDSYPLVEIKRCFDTLCNEQRFRLGYTPVVIADLLGAIADLLPELLPEPVEETLD